LIPRAMFMFGATCGRVGGSAVHDAAQPAGRVERRPREDQIPG
jgi:hypothetical protein